MRKIFLFILICNTLVLPTFAQKENNVWAFGTHAGLDFNNGNPTAVLTNVNGYGEANASVCDANGQLLFYTEGSYVWDRSGTLMPNGSVLTSIPDMSGISATTSTCQGALIVPIPGANNKYYIFSLTSFEFGQNGGRLYYSIVDMNLNGGMGDIITAQKGILLDINLTEKLIATTGEHCNIWLLTSSALDPVFKAFEITNAGINTAPVISNVGNGNSVSGSFGMIAISPNRTKIAATRFFSNCASLYDFDPVTGTVSNPLLLLPGTGNACGVCFSADNSKLYISNHQQSQLLQYNLNSTTPASILASQTIIGACGFTQLQRGPNGKIYFQAGSNGLSIINDPNLLGLASNVQYNVVPISAGSSFYAGLHNLVPVIKYDSTSTKNIVNAPCFATSVSLHATNNQGWNYIWNNGTIGAACNVNAPGIYSVSYRTEPCRLNTDTFILNYPAGTLPQLQITPSCSNASNGSTKALTFAGDSTTYHYIWCNSSNDTLSVTDSLFNKPSGYYHVHISTIDCDTTLSFLISEEHYNLSFVSPEIVCSNAPITFENTSDSYYTQFLWHFNANDIATVSDPVYAYTSAGTFEIMLIGHGLRCSDTTYKHIIVDAPVVGNFVADPKEICMGETIKFTMIPDSTSIKHNWSFGDETGFVDLPSFAVQHAYDRAGVMPVTITSQFRSCPDVIYTDTIVVYEMPKVDLGADSLLCLDGEALTLSNKQPPSASCHYLWNTGETTPTLNVVHPGTYSLTVSNEPLGCSTTESVVVNKDCYIDIPNAFSPNGDGVNDYFLPRQMLASGLVAFSMQIFNRWGQIIFDTQNINGRGWDGCLNGKQQPEGVYIYIISAEIKNGHKESYQGNVTLVR